MRLGDVVCSAPMVVVVVGMRGDIDIPFAACRVDDQFFKLSEMAAFLDQMDRLEAKRKDGDDQASESDDDDAADDNDDVDLFGDPDDVWGQADAFSSVGRWRSWAG